MICSYLSNTGLLGKPNEFFNPRVVVAGGYGKKHSVGQPISMSGYIDWLKNNWTTKNKMFGAKILFEDFNSHKHLLPFQDLMLSARVILLERRSKLKQAISYYFAEKTGQWIDSDAAIMLPEKVPFDYGRIHQILTRLVDQDTRWKVFLEASRIPCLHLIFEDFVKDPRQGIKEIMAYLDVPDQEIRVEAKLAEQKHPAKAMFFDQFAETGLSSYFTPLEGITYAGVDFAQ